MTPERLLEIRSRVALSDADNANIRELCATVELLQDRIKGYQHVMKGIYRKANELANLCDPFD